MTSDDNKKSTYAGLLRPDAITLWTCEQVCREEVKNCTAFYFKNGVCHVLAIVNYDYTQMVDSYGHTYYYTAPCPRRLLIK